MEGEGGTEGDRDRDRHAERCLLSGRCFKYGNIVRNKSKVPCLQAALSVECSTKDNLKLNESFDVRRVMSDGIREMFYSRGKQGMETTVMTGSSNRKKPNVCQSLS